MLPTFVFTHDGWFQYRAVRQTLYIRQNKALLNSTSGAMYSSKPYLNDDQISQWLHMCRSSVQTIPKYARKAANDTRAILTISNVCSVDDAVNSYEQDRQWT